jgi:hypothetical protein
MEGSGRNFDLCYSGGFKTKPPQALPKERLAAHSNVAQKFTRNLMTASAEVSADAVQARCRFPR